MKKTILITGSSSGFGKAAAQKFAAEGWNVIATMRKPETSDLENVFVTRLDVEDAASIQAAVTAGLDKFGSIDVLLNNAGYGMMGPFETASSEQIRKQFDVNVFGLMETTKAVLPHFRANKAGIIINVSSMGGRVTFPAISLYHASKFAIEGFTESLSYELAVQGITVKLVEPGVTDTNFFNATSSSVSDELPVYKELYDKFMEQFGVQNTTPTQLEEVVTAIYTAATDGTDQLRYIAGADANRYIQVKQSKSDEEYMLYMKERFNIPASV